MNHPVTKIIKKDIPAGRRILVTSDIHGHLSLFKKVLEKAEFCENDELVIVGDIVEKGPDSLGALRFVMELCKKGNVTVLIGNVDAYRMELIDNLNENNAEDYYNFLLSTREWFGSSFHDELAEECGYKINAPEDILSSKKAITEHFKEEFDFLAGLPTVVETQSFVFVHGGLYEKEPSDNSRREAYELTKYDSFMSRTEQIFDKYVIVGHWPVNLYNDRIQQLNPVFDRKKHIISLDGGCGTKKYPQLNLLTIPDIFCSDDEIGYISCDGLSKIIALDPQSESENSLHINWLNRKIELLERGEEFSYIKHEQSGKSLYIPNAFLCGKNRCSEYTDFELRVEPGDEMSLIFECSKGIIAKRNGVIGWYYGRFKRI